MKLLICIPTYNEIENIERIIPAVFESCPTEINILVIDDNSPDGTAAAAEKFMQGPYSGRLHLLKRPSKQGLSQAYLAAFDWGISLGYDVFLEMDADFSHNPKYIPEMIEKIKTHDVVIGSRNIKGGGVEGWSFLRNLISKGGSLYSRIVLGCPVKDLTGGFNMWRKSALDKIGLSGIISRGYSFQIEMKFKASLAGCGIAEIPIIFPDRKQGASKMSKKILFEALINVWKIKKSSGRETGLDQFIKFFITGGLGTITNLAVFFLCADILKLPEYSNPVIFNIITISININLIATGIIIWCFLIAATQNYIINHMWSFKTHTAGEGLSLKKWCMFIVSSLLGLAVNLSVTTLVLSNWVLPFKFIAQAFGIAAGMIINFILSKYAVFRKGKKIETAGG